MHRIDLDRRLLREYAEKMRRAALEFTPLPTKEDPLWVSSEAEGEEAVDVLIASLAEGALRPLYNELREKLHEGNSALDTPENYRKVYEKCSAW